MPTWPRWWCGRASSRSATPKHPPLLAWMLWGWFKIFPLADWAYILLAVVTLVGRHLSGDRAVPPNGSTREKLAAVPFLLAAIPFYNFLGLKFDQNSVADPALGARHVGDAARARHAPCRLGGARRARRRRRDADEILVGVPARRARACGARRIRSARDYFRSAAPWVTAGVFLAAVAPHVVWLVRENFPPITWVTTRRISASFGDTLALVRRICSAAPPAMRRRARARAALRPAVAAPRSRDSWFPRDERARRRDPVLDAAAAAVRAGADQEHQPAVALEHARAQSAARDAARLAAA